MNTSMSTAQRPRIVLTGVLHGEPTQCTCPPWCVATHDDHAQDDPGRPLHKGPLVGRLQVWAGGDSESTDLAFSADVAYRQDDDLTVTDLRQLAADALAAAAWIETQS